ncbi:alcohol dehydrogenase catalytic domain-containing protein [Lentzea sp. DG1S-22]|uniref:alcohol dehydrogenase catalytic domain-containing protein n=1 Tax=Lentzea sp. DG1S-22 TaxID=3108822 RepID=UPI002E769652|nr:alcohol dehydrogenase catalytic domain-containing protein [Lentzea sp. DG1S-22]WVH82368.1 alcohol dehydrogenase catalytic domain-containing protein [Lentzea sp. DG1S-22]
MKAAILRAPGVIGVDEVPDAAVRLPTDAVVRVVAAAICGTDLRGFAGMPGPVQGPRCGHEFVGVVEEIGADVRSLVPGDFVVSPFQFSDGTCVACVRGAFNSCRSGGMFGVDGDGGQAEAVRVPFADSTLVPVPLSPGDERVPALLALADVMPTGAHAVRSANLPANATVAVIGDGAVGLCAVLAASRAGAERVFLFGRHPSRLRTGVAFGATDLITARGTEGEAELLEATLGAGADLVVDAVGEQSALDTAMAVCADQGVLTLAGGPHGGLDLFSCFLRGITVGGGLTPVRAYLSALVDDVLAGTLDPSPVFDQTVPLDDIAAGYEAMRDRRATKTLVRV